jgi:multicomponent Na+:H+ antiporter subunit F
VVALDAMSTNVVAIGILYAIHTQETVFLNVSLMLAITGFTATVASSIYIRDGDIIR